MDISWAKIVSNLTNTSFKCLNDDRTNLNLAIIFGDTERCLGGIFIDLISLSFALWGGEGLREFHQHRQREIEEEENVAGHPLVE